MIKDLAPITIVRVGLGITFLWIAVLILRNPEAWGNLLQPWAAGLLPISLRTAMIQTAIFDFAVGFLLLIDKYTLPVSVIAFLHLVLVITVVGITAGTTRDIGLAAAALALIFAYGKKVGAEDA
jgi:hypothetical protein